MSPFGPCVEPAAITANHLAVNPLGVPSSQTFPGKRA